MTRPDVHEVATSHKLVNEAFESTTSARGTQRAKESRKPVPHAIDGGVVF
jgi:hypothetical protein